MIQTSSKESEQPKNKVVPPRDHAMAAKVVDLTHDALPENSWKPIRKEYDKLPAVGVLNDKVLLREWEMNEADEYFGKIYDRRMADVDVFRRFAAQGEVIKM